MNTQPTNKQEPNDTLEGILKGKTIQSSKA